MKIKTITSHDVYNYGASLQAFSLMKFLQENGHEVEIIDYKPDYSRARYNFWYIDSKYSWRKNRLLRFLCCCALFPKRFYTYRRKNAFDRFTIKYLNLTSKTYCSNDALKQAELDAAVFIVGSDQVWNSEHENGKDPANYLDFVSSTSKRISYAASFGMDRIEDGYEDFVKEKIEKFDMITVREVQGVAILAKLGLKSVQVVDPVFLHTAEEWHAMIQPMPIEKYLLVYDFGNNSLIKQFALEFSKKNKVKIYSINDFVPHGYADKNINHAGPELFISLIKNAECFISNSFHGTAFSLIFNTPFFVFNRQKGNVNSRMESLLDLTNLKERIINHLDDFGRMNDPIDFLQANKLLDNKIEESKKCLLDYLC